MGNKRERDGGGIKVIRIGLCEFLEGIGAN